MATRYVLSRSVSECHDDVAAAQLLAEALGHANATLLDEEVVSMEDLTVAAIGSTGSTLSVVDETLEPDINAPAAEATVEEEEDTFSGDASSNEEPSATMINEQGCDTTLEQRKKRVSFNERVQARIYRSTSSIVGKWEVMIRLKIV